MRNGPAVKARSRSHEAEEEFVRFSLTFRLQHIFLFSSTLVLIVSGLPLKYADASWAVAFFHLVGGVQAGGVIHRIGAVVLIGVGVFHMGYIAFSAEGRREFRELMPGFKDVADVGRNLFYFFGFARMGARFGRFSYLEKFDYWAVYWGMVVMILSGLMLWLHDLMMSVLPKYLLDIAREAHSDEALLATLAIIVWHFYNVHLKPSHFPMSRTWLTGKISKEEIIRDHPLEFEKLIAEESGEEER